MRNCRTHGSSASARSSDRMAWYLADAYANFKEPLRRRNSALHPSEDRRSRIGAPQRKPENRSISGTGEPVRSWERMNVSMPKMSANTSGGMRSSIDPSS